MRNLSYSLRKNLTLNFKKLKKSIYVNDKKILKMINVAENSIEEFNKNDNKTPIRLDYVEKREIDRSTVYSFNSPFQLMHADIANLEFLGKSATVPKYALLIVDLFLSKVYVYPMQLQKQLLKYLNIFYVEIKNKRNMRQNTRLQTDNEFQQFKIKDLNDKYNVTMFTTNLHDRKELRKRISKVKPKSDQNKAKISPTTIIKPSAENINNVESEKYKLTQNKIEKKSLENQRFRTEFNFERIKISKTKTSDRLDR